MRTFVTILLLFVVGSLASGVPQYLHLQEHERQDAREEALLALTVPANSGLPTKHLPPHSEEGCPICAQFHAPMISMAHVTWILDSGQWVAYVSAPACDQYSQTSPARTSCRGPPILTAS